MGPLTGPHAQIGARRDKLKAFLNGPGAVQTVRRSVGPDKTQIKIVCTLFKFLQHCDTNIFYKQAAGRATIVRNGKFPNIPPVNVSSDCEFDNGLVCCS